MAIVPRIMLPHGAALYVDPLPKDVNPACIKLVVMAGSADDASCAHGAHHWFEHVPFRGTEAFPKGASQIKGPFARYAGHVGASTGNTTTSFYARVPKSMWQDALEVVIDLAARPLLRPDDVEAERLIIKEEIKQRDSSPGAHIYDRLGEILWPGHPYAHSILGTEEMLTIADPHLITATHAMSYSPERCSVFVSGDITLDSIVKCSSALIQRMRPRNLGERRMPARYGTLPLWQAGMHTDIETSFDTSVVLFLFPYKRYEPSLVHAPVGPLVRGIFSSGGMVSPLYRIVREERRLVYSTHFYWVSFPDGGYWGFEAKCGAANIPGVLEAFKDVLMDPEIRSKERFGFVRDVFWGHQQMNTLDPYDRASTMLSTLRAYGHVLTEDEMMARSIDVAHEEVLSTLDEFTAEKAHTIIFRGKKQ